MLWHTPDGATLLYPPADSRNLVPRIDHLKTAQTSLGLAQDPQPGELGQGQPYDPTIMELVNQRTLENAGILGAYCNYTMAYKGSLGQAPKILPDTLERVIDNDVKLGGSNALVGAKLQELTQQLLEYGVPIPPFLLPRLGVYPTAAGELPKRKKFGEAWVNLRTTRGEHWVDQLSDGVRAYVQRLTNRRNELMRSARLPAAVTDSVADQPLALQLGSQFNQTYTRAVEEARSKYRATITANPRTQHDLHVQQTTQYHELVFAYVREKSEALLLAQPADQRTTLLRGAMVSRELNSKTRSRGKGSLYDELGVNSDAAFWQRGMIAETSLKALQEVGLLGEVVEEVNEHGKRLVRYPTPTQAAQAATYQPVKLKQVWFNRARDAAQVAGQPVPDWIKAVDPATQRQHKQAVRFLAGRTHEQGGFVGLRLYVNERYFGENTTRKKRVLEDEAGRVFGILDKDAPPWELGEEVVIRQAKGDEDGNLRMMVEKLGQMP
jgi:hypothetical protein